jgi:hypothetical protein
VPADEAAGPGAQQLAGQESALELSMISSPLLEPCEGVGSSSSSSASWLSQPQAGAAATAECQEPPPSSTPAAITAAMPALRPAVSRDGRPEPAAR